MRFRVIKIFRRFLSASKNFTPTKSNNLKFTIAFVWREKATTSTKNDSFLDNTKKEKNSDNNRASNIWSDKENNNNNKKTNCEVFNQIHIE